MSTPNHKKTAVLLMAYGSPEKPEDIEPYLTHIKRGTPPSAKLLREMKKRYKAVGGKTPLMEITKQQASALQLMLNTKKTEISYTVYIGMKHWHPFIEETMKAIIDNGEERLIAVALAPHYSRISIGGYMQGVKTALQSYPEKLELVTVESWHTNQYLIDCIVEQLQAASKAYIHRDKNSVHIIFTAHSLPEKIRTWSDPYVEQLLQTSQLVAKRLKLKFWSFAFQSAGATADPWLGPDVIEVMRRLKEKGQKSILICPIGFVSDNLEIVYDLDIECWHVATELGIELQRVESRNTHPLFIKALSDIISSIT